MTSIARTLTFGFLMGGASLLPGSAAEAAPFQRYLNGVCGTATVCNINFPTVAAGKRLEIRNVSCYLRHNFQANILSAQLLVVAANGNIAHAVTLVPQYVTNAANTDEMVWSANDAVFTFANAGQHFRAYAELQGGTFRQFACHISGELLNVPQGPLDARAD